MDEKLTDFHHKLVQGTEFRVHQVSECFALIYVESYAYYIYAEVDTLLHYIFIYIFIYIYIIYIYYIYIHRHKHIVTLSKKMQPFFSFFEIIVRTSPDPAKQSLETRSWGS